jgi:thiol:disulfide interchange protein DsbD
MFSLGSLHAEGFGTIEGLPQSNFMEPQDAFKVAAKIEDDTLKTAIILGENIHAYTKDLRYTVTAPKKADLDFTKPPTVKYEGEDVFYGTQVIDIPLKQLRSKGLEGNITLQIHISGCSDEGICYNPQTRTFDLTMPATKTLSEEEAAEQQQLKELAEEEALENQAEVQGFQITQSPMD